MGDATKNFNFAEFASQDGTNQIKIETIRMVQKIRDYVSRKVFVNSGYRSKADNERIYKTLGKKPLTTSAHLAGEAADIWAEGLSKKQLGDSIKEMYIKGFLPELEYCYLINEGNRAVHVGIDKKKRANKFGF